MSGLGRASGLVRRFLLSGVAFFVKRQPLPLSLPQSWPHSLREGPPQLEMQRGEERPHGGAPAAESSCPPLVTNIGNGAGSHGAVTVTGAGSLWSDIAGIRIGNSGAGALTIADSGRVIAPTVTIAPLRSRRTPDRLEHSTSARARAIRRLHPARSLRRASCLALEPVRSTSITRPPAMCSHPRSAAGALSTSSQAPRS